MFLSEEMADEVRTRIGINLLMTSRTHFIRIAAEELPDGFHLNEIHGPFKDPDNDDVRIFVNYRVLRGHYSLELLVQDRDDDTFLNSHAQGTEKYHDKQALWSASSVR